MKYLTWYQFDEIVSWLPHDEQSEARIDFLLTGECFIERIERPHVLPEYKLERSEKIEAL